MAPRLNWSAAALALTLLAGTVSPIQARDESERPDLKVELIGLPLASGQRTVQVRVTNTSAWWAQEMKQGLTVETVSPTAPNTKKYDVENLDPGQSATFTYTLAAPCEGQEVRAHVTPGRNYANLLETELANNTVQARACPLKVDWRFTPPPAPKAPPAKQDNLPVPSGSVDPTEATTGRGRTGAALPVEDAPPDSGTLQPRRSGVVAIKAEAAAERTLELAPSDILSTYKTSKSGLCDAFTERFEKLVVGWWQQEYDCLSRLHLGGGSAVVVAQTAVSFDLTQLDKVANKRITSAVLSFNEQVISATTGDGQPSQVSGCVEVLGRATGPWNDRAPDGLFRNEKTDGHAPGVQQWTVTERIQLWAENTKPRFGFVLRGGNESPKGEDNASCLSTVDGFKLTVKYIAQN